MLLVATFFGPPVFHRQSTAMEQQRLVPDAGTWFFALVGAMYRFGIAGVLLALFLNRSPAKLTKLEIEQGFWLAVFGVGGIFGSRWTACPTPPRPPPRSSRNSTSAFIPVWVALVHRHLPKPKVVVSPRIGAGGIGHPCRSRFQNLQTRSRRNGNAHRLNPFGGQILMLERPRYASNDPSAFPS